MYSISPHTWNILYIYIYVLNKKLTRDEVNPSWLYSLPVWFSSSDDNVCSGKDQRPRHWCWAASRLLPPLTIAITHAQTDRQTNRRKAKYTTRNWENQHQKKWEERVEKKKTSPRRTTFIVLKFSLSSWLCFFWWWWCDIGIIPRCRHRSRCHRGAVDVVFTKLVPFDGVRLSSSWDGVFSGVRCCSWFCSSASTTIRRPEWGSIQNGWRGLKSWGDDRPKRFLLVE